MTIDAIHEDGIVRRHRIDPLVVWQRLSGPQRVIPVPSQDPLTGLQSGGVLLDSPYELGGGGSVPKIDRRELEATVDEMSVPVGEPRQDQAAVGLYGLCLRADVGGDRRVVPDRQNLARGDRHVAGVRATGGEPGPHHASADDEIRLLPAGGEEKAQCSREKASAHRSLNGVW